MEKLFLIAFVLISASFFGQETRDINDEFKYRIVYDLHFQPDSTDVDSRKREAMVLYVGDKISQFSSMGKVAKDSLQNSLNAASFSQANFERINEKMPKTSFNYYIHKTKPAGEISYTEKIIKDNFRYTEEEDLHWEILPETDSLHGFKVQKATTNFAGREYTAWFTSEIPIPDGPYKFAGLPGLILKISDSKDHYVFEISEFKKLQEPLPISFDAKTFILTTEEDFNKTKKEYEKDPISFINNTTNIKISFSYDSPGEKARNERERKERLKKENNPIELE